MRASDETTAMLWGLVIVFTFVGGFGVALGPTCIGWSTAQGDIESDHWEVRCVMSDGTERRAKSRKQA
jgi:hypothetical protein